MIKKIFFLLLLCTAFALRSQTNADCINYIPLCATPSFTFYPTAGNGNVNDIPAGNNTSNPSTNPNPPNMGCLLQGENVPQWLLITVGNAGVLEFVFGAGNSPNPQIGYYDWAMWPYSPTACANIQNNTLPPIRCNWNAVSSGGTGIAGPGNIPPGGSSGNFEAPLAVNACQQFIICISNWSGVNTLVSFQSLGTASLSCNPNCSPSYSICAGNNVTITAVNFAALANPSFSIQPGGQTNNTGTFVVSPSVTTNYTIFTTGTNQANAVQTTTGVSTVSVFPSPLLAPTFTQATCSNSVNAVNLGLSFNPAGAPNYTVTWSPVPPGPPTPTQTSVTGLPPGTTNVTVTAAGGCSVTTSFVMNPTVSPAVFTMTPAGGNSLTCTNTMITVSNAPTNYTYTWVSLSNTLSGSSATFSIGTQGTYTVTASNGISGCSTTQTVSIGINTLAPTNSVNPTSQVINCSSVAAVTFSGYVTSPTVNIQHDWYSPMNPPPGGVPISTSNNTISILSGNIPPGVYTLVTTNLVNGCTAMKTVTITGLAAFPTFSVASPTNFSLGCSPLNQTTISIINPVSTQTPPSTCNYAFLAPSFTGSPTFGANTSTPCITPGTWTVIVQDQSNGCQSQLAVPITINTVAPNVSASMLTQTLTCYNPTVLATGTSTTANTGITWLIPLTPPNYSQPTVVIGSNTTGPNTSTTSLTYATFTVVATNSLNACQSSSVVVINQNFKPPVSQPTISIATATAIYCTVNTNPVVLTTGSSTTTSGGGPTAFVANPCWQGPAPQTSTCGPSSYSAYVAGIYTLTVMDNYNGCTKSGTVQVLDRTQLPVIATPVDQATLDCGNNGATMNFSLAAPMVGGIRYLVTRYPLGSAFSPSNAIVFDINPLLSGTSSTSVTVSKPGQYIYIVSNTLTGCQAMGTVNVMPGDITAEFSPDASFGYAPLTVNFNNTSHTSLGTGSINSIWSFGNGSSFTNSNNANASTTYTSPGTYTILLIAQKGTCIDTTQRVIKVDLPSVVEAPNVFTPNGDGVNDLFFLKTASISEVYALIYDRWGNKVYETTSSNGNISWDGKNLQGKECAAGTYFYIIKAKGKDTKDYQLKGNVSIFR